tara:strand:+ start:700 stop:1206 length:507 start_codon:yes stop_codon:yes gene_type:complete
MNRLKSIKKEVGKIVPILFKKHGKDHVLKHWDVFKRHITLDMCEHLCEHLSSDDVVFYLRAKRKIRGTDKLYEKVAYKKYIDKHEENGKVAIVSGGMDCDHTRWDDDVDILDANIVSVNQWEQRFYDGAEGQQWWSLETMAYANSLSPSSRDLAMEAFEDGHPYNIYP